MNDHTRREFLKNCFKMGGYAAIAGLGIGSVRDAMAWGILPALTNSGSVVATSWASWNETSEVGLKTDQDGDGVDDTFIAFMENMTASGNETGRAGTLLSGAELVLTQNGDIAGATGSPPSRNFDGVDNYMTFHNSVANMITGGGNWTIAIKMENWNPDSNAECSFHLAGGGGIDIIEWLYLTGTSLMSYLVRVDNAAKLTGSFTDKPDTSGVVYFLVWYDGSDIRSGFIDGGSPAPNTKPTKWSDFNANDRATATIAVTFTPGDFDTYNIGTKENNAAYCQTAKYYYIVFSKTCLIDNAS